MQFFRADLHIHTVLSPCADLTMTPDAIVKKAKDCGLDIIGITDHNSTLNSQVVKKLAAQTNLLVLTGAEITTKEEVHSLVFFENEHELNDFQRYIENNIQKIPNPDGHFGYQPVVDAKNKIDRMIPYYLAAAINKSISEIEKKVHKLNGIFIPAHIDRPRFGIFGQLGFIPENLKYDALGISKNINENYARKHYVLKDNISLIQNSDAHFLNQIEDGNNRFFMEKCTFREVKMALNQQNNRNVGIV